MRSLRKPLAGQGGFNIVELLIAVIIIGILVAVVVPVMTRYAGQARVAAAKSDLEMISTAEQRLSVDTGGYLVRLFALDDVLGGDGEAQFANATGLNNSTDVVDGLRDELINSYYGVALERLFIDPNTGEFLDSPSLVQAIINTETDFTAAFTTAAWNGPYLSWRKDLDIPGVTLGAGERAMDDIGNDPWGNNYIMFTSFGVLNEPEGTFLKDLSGIDTQVRDTGTGFVSEADLFDRTTFLSMGPDGLPGGSDQPVRKFGGGDDLITQF